jgi:hypothetical protein
MARIGVCACVCVRASGSTRASVHLQQDVTCMSGTKGCVTHHLSQALWDLRLETVAERPEERSEKCLGCAARMRAESSRVNGKKSNSFGSNRALEFGWEVRFELRCAPPAVDNKRGADTNRENVVLWDEEDRRVTHCNVVCVDHVSLRWRLVRYERERWHVSSRVSAVVCAGVGTVAVAVHWKL